LKRPAFHISHSFLACVFTLLAGLIVGLVLSPFTELQAQDRQDVWFQSSNVLSRQVALEDTSLTPRQAERKYEDTIYELHGELIMPQSSSELDDEASLEQNTQLHPAIIFLVGSGPNSTHTGLYADFVRENLEGLFLQHGVALMYFDKRGVGLSEGRWHRTDLYERADDARAAVQFLRQQAGIDPERIGVVGHSQGGTVAQILGHLYGDSLAFIASLAAPTYDTQRRLTYEYYNDFLCSGEPDDIARDKAEKKTLSDLNWVNAFPLTKTWRHLSELSDFSPASHLAQLQLPSYFAFAELDYYVSTEWGMDALEQAGLATIDAQYEAGNSTKATIELFPGLDHDFRPTPNVCTGAELEFENRRHKKESDHSSADPVTSLETPKSDAMKSEKPTYSKEFQQSFQQWVLAQFRLGVL
jgi:pimeloyl-ACP methyl ester carboxylesterase